MLPITVHGVTTNKTGFIDKANETLFLARLSNENAPYVVKAVTPVDTNFQLVTFSKILYNGSYSKPVTLSNSSANSWYPITTSSGDNVYVFWGAVIELPNGDYYYQLHYAVSNDAGKTFVKDIDLSNTNEPADRPAIAAVDNKVFVAWEERSSGIYKILLRYSGDSGRTFSSIIPISDSTLDCRDPAIAYAQGHLFVAWTETGNYTSAIKYRELDYQERNGTFSIAHTGNIGLLSAGNDVSDNPQIAITKDGRNIYSAWSAAIPQYFEGHRLNLLKQKMPSPQIDFRSSNDGGYTWNSIKGVSTTPQQFGAFTLGVNGDAVHVIWYAYVSMSTPGQASFYTHSRDGGQTFTRPYAVNPGPLGASELMLVSGSTVYISWDNGVTATRAFVVSYDDGDTFTNLLKDQTSPHA
ncbi:MAG: sialidase family protein [Nitrososphaera sp.]